MEPVVQWCFFFLRQLWSIVLLKCVIVKYYMAWFPDLFESLWAFVTATWWVKENWSTNEQALVPLPDTKSKTMMILFITFIVWWWWLQGPSLKCPHQQLQSMHCCFKVLDPFAMSKNVFLQLKIRLVRLSFVRRRRHSETCKSDKKMQCHITKTSNCVIWLRCQSLHDKVSWSSFNWFRHEWS